MKTYRADLHIHSCLSPCGRAEMTPRAIVEAALARGLDLIAVTDHNTARMAPVVARVARRHGLAFLYGLELQTQEDVHLLAYFDDEDACLAFSDEVYELLPNMTEDPFGLGEQIETDEHGRAVRREPKFLVNGLRLTFLDAARLVGSRGGLAVPAHVDRDLFSIRSQLGALPTGVAFPIVEVRERCSPELCGSAAILRTSDAHALCQIGDRTTRLVMEAPTVAEIRAAAAAADGRCLASSGD